MKIIAIDPGASGGIAWLDEYIQPHVVPMPSTDGDILTQLREIGFVNSRAVIEQVGGYIAGNKLPGSAMFNFGRGYGFIIGILMAYNVRVELVRPQAWQKALSLGSRAKDQSKSDWKNKLKAASQRLYPEMDITLKTCDSLLLLEYARKHPIQ
jgi:hypothetical protein